MWPQYYFIKLKIKIQHNIIDNKLPKLVWNKWKKNVGWQSWSGKSVQKGHWSVKWKFVNTVKLTVKCSFPFGKCTNPLIFGSGAYSQELLKNLRSHWFFFFLNWGGGLIANFQLLVIAGEHWTASCGWHKSKHGMIVETQKAQSHFRFKFHVKKKSLFLTPDSL